MKAIAIESQRRAYRAVDVSGTMTISELIDCLQEMAEVYGDDVPVVTSNDQGYTYGPIDWNSVNVC